MRNINLIRYTWICLLMAMISSGCKKGFLDKKPNTNIVVPATLADMSQLLDNHDVVTYNSPTIGILSTEEFHYPSLQSYNSRPSKTEKNCFIWNKDIYSSETNIADWNGPYSAILYANVVLDQWEKLPESDKVSINGKNIKAWALFTRAFSLYNLVRIFSPAYNLATASSDLGIPLKLSPEINNVVKRASLKQTYDQILADLAVSMDLYSSDIPTLSRNRPSRAAAHALLSRIYLSMREYKKALENADKSLSLYDKLIDYNSVDPIVSNPFSLSADETIYYNITNLSYNAVQLIGNRILAIDDDLISLYDSNDLRRDIYFQKVDENYFMKRGYGQTYPLTGLAVDELYLIKAECEVRVGNLSIALRYYNKLLLSRFKFGSYTELVTASTDILLHNILLERRKELPWRGVRWDDLRRLNLEGSNLTLTRQLGTKTFTLPANDPRYVMPIPLDEINISHLEQNIR